MPWRDDPNTYHMWLSEIMLQQTQVKTVIPYYYKWLQLFPTIYDVANADEQDILKAWEGAWILLKSNKFFRCLQNCC